MAAQPVDWVLVIFYNTSAHRATYGRLASQDTKYTKDYIQLSRKQDFIDEVQRLFTFEPSNAGAAHLTYVWPRGSATGELVLKSSDRPHLKWETSDGAPAPWKMALAPSSQTAETIPGDPTHRDFAAAEQEFKLLSARGGGQPYLVAIKLRDESNKLHVRVYLDGAEAKYSWADIGRTPEAVRELATKTSQTSALKWSSFQSSGVAPGKGVKEALAGLDQAAAAKTVIDAFDPAVGLAVTRYLQRPAVGLFFDPTRNHDAWVEPVPISAKIATNTALMDALLARYSIGAESDVIAETLIVSAAEIDAFREQMQQKNYAVDDAHATVKTRGSAQRVFSEAVKKHYGHRCAITGIVTRDFLVAAHIVPWSEDQTIRLDPANGICLSLLVDCAFENGHVTIEDNLAVRVNWVKVGEDTELGNQLRPYDGKQLRRPTKDAPLRKYLERRRALVAAKVA